MEELITAIATDLPSTAALLLILYLVNSQFAQVIKVVERHLENVNTLLQRCIERGLDWDEVEEQLNRRRRDR